MIEKRSITGKKKMHGSRGTNRVGGKGGSVQRERAKERTRIERV